MESYGSRSPRLSRSTPRYRGKCCWRGSFNFRRDMLHIKSPSRYRWRKYKNRLVDRLVYGELFLIKINLFLFLKLSYENNILLFVQNKYFIRS